MNHIAVKSRRVLRYRGPAGWVDLTAAQFGEAMRAEIAQTGPAGRFALLLRWYRMPYLVLRALDGEGRDRLVQLLAFLDGLPGSWLLPRLSRGGWPMLGPGDGLRHLPFGAYMFAEAALLAHAASPEREHLVDLAASLYAPRAWPWQAAGDGGRRPYCRQQLARQVGWARTLPDHVLRGIWRLYVGNRAGFPLHFSHLFRPSTGGGGSATWLDVGLGLARKTGALGTFDHLSTQPTYLVLTTLDALIKEDDELKRALER